MLKIYLSTTNANPSIAGEDDIIFNTMQNKVSVKDANFYFQSLTDDFNSSDPSKSLSMKGFNDFISDLDSKYVTNSSFDELVDYINENNTSIYNFINDISDNLLSGIELINSSIYMLETNLYDVSTDL